MTWTAQHKDMFTTETKSWPSPHPKVIGRALSIWAGRAALLDAIFYGE